MEYISREEFLKQSDKVQREFKEYFDGESMLFWNNECLVYWGFEDILINTPAITEGQLRKFIEDKTDRRVELLIDEEINQYMISATNDCLENDFILFDELGISVLQAYWKVACEIAKEELKHD